MCVVGVETLVDVYRYELGHFPVLRLGVGDSQAKEDADRMKFVHQQRWSWLQSLGRKG